MKKIQTIMSKIIKPKRLMRPIGPMRLNGLNRHAGFMVCLLVCLFTSCNSELDGPDSEEKGIPINIAGYLAPFEESEGGTRAEPAWMPDGYTLLEGVKSIGAFYTQTSTCDVRRIWWHDRTTNGTSAENRFPLATSTYMAICPITLLTWQ